MKINSHKKLFGFWLSVIAISGGLFDLLFFRSISIPATLLIIFINVFLVLIIGLAFKNLWEGNKIEINTHIKQIFFQNIITQKHRFFPFDYFDGYITIQGRIAGKSIKYLYLVKDRKAIRKICSFAYSNFDELRMNLNEIKYLGELKYSGNRTIRVLLNLPILK